MGNSERSLSDVDIVSSYSGASGQFRARVVAVCASIYKFVNSAFKRMFSLRFLFRYLVHSANHACAAQSLGKTLCAALRFMTPIGLLVKFGIQALCAVQSHIFS